MLALVPDYVSFIAPENLQKIPPGTGGRGTLTMITLYTAATPNGRKASIMLEECELDYDAHPMALGRREQKQDWYVNGGAIRDHFGGVKRDRLAAAGLSP